MARRETQSPCSRTTTRREEALQDYESLIQQDGRRSRRGISPDHLPASSRCNANGSRRRSSTPQSALPSTTSDLMDEASRHSTAKDLIAQIEGMSPVTSCTTRRSRSSANTSTITSRRNSTRVPQGEEDRGHRDLGEQLEAEGRAPEGGARGRRARRDFPSAVADAAGALSVDGVRRST